MLLHQKHFFIFETVEKVAFIINPNSAKKNYRPFLRELQRKIENPLFLVSESVDSTVDFIKENYKHTEVFVAIGGDGTISTVAKQIINTEKILAVFPAGSGNGFSNETNFDRDLDLLLKKIEERKYRKIDTFTVNGRLSINVSGTGFDGKVVKEFEKTSRGFLNYIKVSLQTFFTYKPIKIKFLTEQYKKYDGKYLMLNIANTRQFGNNAYIAPMASKSDGLLEVVLVKKFPVPYSALFAYRMFTKNLKDDAYVKYLSVPEIKFEVNTTTWHLDGEFNEITSPVHVKVIPESLNILI